MELIQARAGRPFTIAVGEAIRSFQKADPLRSVTVLSPSNAAGLSLRRLLGSGVLAHGGNARHTTGGIVNVSFATPFQFASTVASPELARTGERPLTTAVLAAAVRFALRETNGRFREVAQHTATETTLLRSYAELSQLSDDDLDALSNGGTERTRELVAFVRQVRNRLEAHGAGYHDERRVFDVAGASFQRSDHALILAGPFDPLPAANRFLAIAASQLSSAGVVAIFGDQLVDANSVEAMTRLGGTVTGAIDGTAFVPTALLPASDTDEEARTVVRSIIELAEQGARFDRVGVFTPTAEPYSRSLRQQLAFAGIPTAGPDHRTLADSMAGRLTRRLLELSTPDALQRQKAFERESVLSFAASAPLRGANGRPLRSGPWEVISRRAGVVGGIDDWRTKLERHINNLESEVASRHSAEEAASVADRRTREAQAAKELLTFVESLYQRTDPRSIGSTWAERAGYVLALLQELLPLVGRRTMWPESEAAAAEQVEVLVRRVSVLDELEPDAPWSAFVRAVELELDGPGGTRGKFGTGVLIAPLAMAVGLDLDHVFVVGMAEGTCPRPSRDDTLLPDSERQTVDALTKREDRQLADRKRYLAALSAGAISVTLTTPIGDHRNGRLRTVSRWWVEAMRNLGAPEGVNASDWREYELAQSQPERSFATQLRRHAELGLATTSAELHLQQADAWKRSATSEVAQSADLPRNLRIAQSILVDGGTRFDRFRGDLAHLDLPRVSGEDSIVSATRLESWAACPRRYYFANVLGLSEIEAPETIVEISAMDKGTLVHEVLEKFIAEALPGEAHHPTSPDEPWGAEALPRLLDHAKRSYESWERRGLTGRALLWRIEQERLAADLEEFLTKDDTMRQELRTVPDNVEMAIGFSTDDDDESLPAASFTLADGRVVRFRGFADRVDRRSDGSPVVVDYKTGSPKVSGTFVGGVLAKDPVAGGTKLQLGVYAEAAKEASGAERSSAWYWFTSDKGGYKRAGYDWTAQHREIFVETVDTVVSGIESGLFPPNPGEFNSFFNSYQNCGFCDFTSICSTGRSLEHDAAVDDARFDRWHVMKNRDVTSEEAGS